MCTCVFGLPSLGLLSFLDVDGDLLIPMKVNQPLRQDYRSYTCVLRICVDTLKKGVLRLLPPHAFRHNSTAEANQPLCRSSYLPHFATCKLAGQCIHAPLILGLDEFGLCLPSCLRHN